MRSRRAAERSRGARDEGLLIPDMAAENDFIPSVVYRKLEAAEILPGVPGRTVLDYWQWAHSDVLENVQRGIFAEFLVAAALGIADNQRVGWAGYDLDYNGFELEIKSSAYLQSWKQKALSNPRFGIGARQQLLADGAYYDQDPRYVADCYVFCLFTDTDGPSANVLDAGRWEFFVVGISQLIAACGSAKSLSLHRLKTIAPTILYADLRQRIDETRAGIQLPVRLSSAQELSRARDVEAQKRVGGAKLRTYMVAQRKTRFHPVIVTACNYEEAQLLARVDTTIASFGKHVSAFALSDGQLGDALRAGAIDLRSQKLARD